MINLYKGIGIFGSEEPVRQTTKRLISYHRIWYSQCMVLASIILFFQKCTDAVMNSKFAYTGMLLGQKLETEMIS